MLYVNTCRALKEADKILVSFMICCKIMIIQKKITADELRFFAIGGTSAAINRPNPNSNWLTSK